MTNNNTAPEQETVLDDNKETGDRKAAEERHLKPFKEGVYATRTASGAICGVAMLLAPQWVASSSLRAGWAYLGSNLCVST